MNSKTTHQCKGGKFALLLLLTIMLPSCGQAEEADTSQQAATDPIQVAQAQPGSGTSGGSTGGGKPNILVIWGDDVGYWNVSAYNQGMMGYETPNIDSLANEGALFTDWYAQQSCTAGRAAFILGQHPFRTGLLTIGMPGSPHGIGDEMVTLATLLKPHGYTSGQFGKNHLGDRDEHLPTAHGFDEFYGNLYHLNAVRYNNWKIHCAILEGNIASATRIQTA